MAMVGKTAKFHLVPAQIPCSKQGQLQQAAQSHVQWGIEDLQGWKLHIFSRQLVPEFDHPHNKKVYSFF